MDSVTIVLITISVIFFGSVIFNVVEIIAHQLKRDKAIDNLYNYEDVQIGMDEKEMLEIMGNDFNKSSLKNGRYKYEWRVSAVSENTFGGKREYSGVKKVAIYVKNGVVEEIKPYNV